MRCLMSSLVLPQEVLQMPRRQPALRQPHVPAVSRKRKAPEHSPEPEENHLSMPPKAEVQKWPSKYVIQESLRQYSYMPIDKIEDRLSWLLKVWPGCAIKVVAERDELSPERREVVRKWGEDNLRPGNYDPTGLHQ